MESEPEKKHKLGFIAFIVLFIIAVLADALTFIPFVGIIVGPMFWAGATLYFWKAGMGLMNWGRVVTSIISTITELIPFLQEFPLITVGVIVIFI
ncbi:MAG: hypothetical protein M3Q80_02345, partial [bacterium]|nr:hypothetical protein [bacterium]